jgi:hypothetical protein
LGLICPFSSLVAHMVSHDFENLGVFCKLY